MRSTAELEKLFEALSAGAREVEVAGYHGRFMEFPDGTTIGYRFKARSTVEPTIDIANADRMQLKIHVNSGEWV